MKPTIMTAKILLALTLLTLSLAELNDVEKLFLQIPSADSSRKQLQYYTSQPHLAGTSEDYETAVYTANQLLSYGISDVTIQNVSVLLNYPSEEKSILDVYDVSGSLLYSAKLEEHAYAEDPLSDTYYGKHIFNGYAPSGEVQGEVVYANYGRIEDFEYLTEELSIDLAGKIVIVRYGRIFRGLKVWHAQRYNASACIIYSDPISDGYVKGKTYPEGPWKPESGVQRGSVHFNSLCPGDPGFVSRDPDICGYKKDEIIPHIPVLPISYGDAEPILNGLQGTSSPKSWKGGLKDVDYNIGPGPIVVHLKIANDFVISDIWNVIAVIKGSEDPEQKVYLGNHRDAWIYGAADPNSGTVALLEIGRSYGEMLKKGWNPKRTIVLCSWDGEEYGMLGSTAYGEQNAESLKKEAIAYLNVDVGVTGPELSFKATPSMIPLVLETARDIEIKDKNETLLDRWNKKIGRLGSGSDYTVFLDHLGIASFDATLAQKEAGTYGVYHSVYDSFHWMETFGDPDFSNHVLISQLWGLLALRLADNQVLNLNYSIYGIELQKYVEETIDLAARYNISLDVSELRNAVNYFENIATEVQHHCQILSKDPEISQSYISFVNNALFSAERLFLSEGVPKRKYFKHVIQAPGIDEGYASQAFPGIVQGLIDVNDTMIEEQVTIAAMSIRKVADFLHSTILTI